MAKRVFESYADQADEIGTKLRELRPSGKEIDSVRIWHELTAFRRGLNEIEEARAREARRGNDQA